MLFSDSYFTIAEYAQGIFKDRGSKFLGFAFPVKSEIEIKNHLVSIKKQHPSANHHCYAWRLGPDKNAFRANDDGEPTNTAGKPILAQIQSNDLTDVLIIVVRYFGGTLLGVNGLINAYKLAASETIAQAIIVEKFIFFEYSVEFGFDDISSVMRILKEYDTKIIANTYEVKNNIVFQVKKQHSETLENKFLELYTTQLKFLKLV